MSPFAIAARGDESGAAKICEVSRDFWLISPQNLNARTDAEFIVAQEVNEAQARWIGQGLED